MTAPTGPSVMNAPTTLPRPLATLPSWEVAAPPNALIAAAIPLHALPTWLPRDDTVRIAFVAPAEIPSTKVPLTFSSISFAVIPRPPRERRPPAP